MKKIEKLYEKNRPLIIWLGIVELVWIGSWLFSASDRGIIYTAITVFWMISMLVWMSAVIVAAKKGVYLKYSFLFSNLIGFVFVIFFPIILFSITDAGIESVTYAVSLVSDDQLILFHTMRLLAIGTIIKFMQGQLPLHFLLLGSLTDFLFALSAVTLAIIGSTVSLSPNFYIVWHCAGIGVFFGAGISMFFSVPSPFRMFYDKPNTEMVFKYPMVLAPNFTVPLFVVAHLLALTKLVLS
jgi:hypothetical protein